VDLFALDIGLLEFGPTPLRLLLVLVLLGAVVLGLMALGTVVFAQPIDKKWPPDEPLDPTEMLWGEVGGFVQKSFAGLDLNLARDLASYMDEVKVPADSWIVQYGDPASHYFVLKKGQAELYGGGGAGPVSAAPARPIQEGEGFGDGAIRRRTLSDIGVRAVTECVVLKLDAADYVAALAVSAASDQPDPERSVVMDISAVRAGVAATPPAEPSAPPPSSTPPPPPPPAAPPGATPF
jgi:hypothetical protein